MCSPGDVAGGVGAADGKGVGPDLMGHGGGVQGKCTGSHCRAVRGPWSTLRGDCKERVAEGGGNDGSACSRSGRLATVNVYWELDIHL